MTPEQIVEMNLPTRETKGWGERHGVNATRARGFGPVSCELDAIPPQRLRQMVPDVIRRHLSDRKLKALKRAQQEERETEPTRDRGGPGQTGGSEESGRGA